jgi:hypothetical protein
LGPSDEEGLERMEMGSRSYGGKLSYVFRWTDISDGVSSLF